MNNVAHSKSQAIGFDTLTKGAFYYPMQWAAGLAGMAIVSILSGTLPTANMMTKVAAVRGVGVAMNAEAPFESPIHFEKTPTQNLYDGNLFAYGVQRPLYALTSSIWPAAFAIGLTFMMPGLGAGIIGVGQALTAAGASMASAGGLSGLAAATASIASTAAATLGGFFGALPAAFAVPEGVTFAGMALSTASKVFQVTLAAAVITDIIGLEKWNPKHKVLRAERNDGQQR